MTDWRERLEAKPFAESDYGKTAITIDDAHAILQEAVAEAIHSAVAHIQEAADAWTKAAKQARYYDVRDIREGKAEALQDCADDLAARKATP